MAKYLREKGIEGGGQGRREESGCLVAFFCYGYEAATLKNFFSAATA